MKVFKLVTSCLVLLIIALFVYQNLATFAAPQEFKLNFYFESSSGKLALYALLLLSAAVGFLVGIAVMLKTVFWVHAVPWSRTTRPVRFPLKVKSRMGTSNVPFTSRKKGL